MIPQSFTQCNPHYQSSSNRGIVLKRAINKIQARYKNGFLFKEAVHKCDTFVSHLGQVSPQKVVHTQAAYGALYHAGQGIIHQISGDAQGFGQQFIDPA